MTLPRCLGFPLFIVFLLRVPHRQVLLPEPPSRLVAGLRMPLLFPDSQPAHLSSFPSTALLPERSPKFSSTRTNAHISSSIHPHIPPNVRLTASFFPNILWVRRHPLADTPAHIHRRWSANCSPSFPSSDAGVPLLPALS